MVLVGLCLGCASAAKPASSSPSGAASFDDAKKRADAAWQTADTQKTSAPAWDHAGEALALAARAAGDDSAAAAPLLKGALAAWRKGEKIQPALDKAGPNNNQRRNLTRRETLRVAVLVQLAALTDPHSPELAMIEYRHGRVLWNYAHYGEAVGHFSAVVEQFPDRQEAKYASSLLLDSLLNGGDLDELEKQASRMLKNKILTGAHPDLVETLQLVRHQASKRAANELVELQSYRACGDAFLALHKRDKKMARVKGDELLYNASVCLERAKQNKRAINVLSELIRLYPESQFANAAKTRAKELAASK
jgi:TolA-binding protein